MVKLSELDNNVKVSYNERIYTVEEVRNDLRYFTDDEEIKLYTTAEYHANIDAKDMLESAIDSEYEYAMYEDWDERIWEDITDEDIKTIQDILDDILSRNENIAYYEDKEIEIDLKEV